MQMNITVKYKVNSVSFSSTFCLIFSYGLEKIRGFLGTNLFTSRYVTKLSILRALEMKIRNF